MFMIINSLDYEIDRIYFLTPYDLIYQDSANHVGLIQLSVEDIGLVCKWFIIKMSILTNMSKFVQTAIILQHFHIYSFI